MFIAHEIGSQPLADETSKQGIVLLSAFNFSLLFYFSHLFFMFFRFLLLNLCTEKSLFSAATHLLSMQTANFFLVTKIFKIFGKH